MTQQIWRFLREKSVKTTTLRLLLSQKRTGPEFVTNGQGLYGIVHKFDSAHNLKISKTKRSERGFSYPIRCYALDICPSTDYRKFQMYKFFFTLHNVPFLLVNRPCPFVKNSGPVLFCDSSKRRVVVFTLFSRRNLHICYVTFYDNSVHFPFHFAQMQTITSLFSI